MVKLIILQIDENKKIISIKSELYEASRDVTINKYLTKGNYLVIVEI